ncbi:MAG TPA: hypothetical protein EYP04_05175 [Anaerolineae bacterium]|nr:hypothetical protein [Anaerolineae bacterium]
MRRIISQEKEIQVGAEQVNTLLADETLPLHGELCAQVEGSKYSTAPFLRLGASNGPWLPDPPMLQARCS